ncbi:MAG: lipoyl synthase, partial [Spirochaetia bacterium]
MNSETSPHAAENRPGEHVRKPEWLRIPVRGGENLKTVKELLERLHLHTVCVEANCPNRMECFSSKTATFMILGSVCTRNCRFCDVKPGVPSEVESDEPARLAEAVKELGLEHVVITSVTRDDLADGGAAHFAETVRAVRSMRVGESEKESSLTIEVLIPDFRGDYSALSVVADSQPDIINHNIETVSRLYEDVRPQA